ncbi:MAG: ribonuclease H-like domain-containing protein [Vicinamibacterales bacterium]
MAMSPEPSRLSSRLRELLRTTPAPAGARHATAPIEAPAPPAGERRELIYEPEEASGLCAAADRGCVVLERHYDLEMPHGRQAVADYGETLTRCLPALAVLAADERAAAPREARPARLDWGASRGLADERRRAGVPTDGPLLFFDLETTGLSGGAGTLAFLVGCGYFDDEGFHTRQFFLGGYEAEREVLDALTALAGRFNGLITFNGRTFDVPLIETRYLFHRLASPFADMPHFDMLHPARRLWRRRNIAQASHRERWSGGRAGEHASCALGALEEAILGVARVGDVPGFEIPSRYFNYLRTGDLAPLAPVFEHNRLDLLSLAAITAIAARMAGEGPAGAPSPHEALAMARIYVRLGRWEEAETCFARAGGIGAAPWDARSIDPEVRADALRQLAIERRRRHRYEEAAEAWRLLLDAGAGAANAQEARRALAIHHEHRARNLEEARRQASRALASAEDPADADALRHRIARLDRKLGRG